MTTKCTKTIEVINCKTCPYSKQVHNGKKLLCIHTKVQVAFPYEPERIVDGKMFAEFCPL